MDDGGVLTFTSPSALVRREGVQGSKRRHAMTSLSSLHEPIRGTERDRGLDK